MIFDGRNDFLPFREKENSDFCGYFSLFPIVAAYLAIRLHIYPILQGISFSYNKLQGNFGKYKHFLSQFIRNTPSLFQLYNNKRNIRGFFRSTRHLLRYRNMAQEKSPNLREMKRMISIDLVEAALAQRQFLKLVDDNPCLYTGPHVENAVRRYESVLRIQSRPINANQVIATSPCLPQP